MLGLRPDLGGVWAVLSAWPGGCLFWACPGTRFALRFLSRCWGLFSSPLGVSDLSTSPPCGGGFFCWVLRPDLGGVWLFLSAWPGGCCFWGVSGLGLRCVVCPGAGGLFPLL